MRNSFKIAIDILYLNRAWTLIGYFFLVISPMVALVYLDMGVSNAYRDAAFVVEGGKEYFAEVLSIWFLLLFTFFSFGTNIDFMRVFNVTRKKFFASYMISLGILSLLIALTQKIINTVFASPNFVYSMYEFIYGDYFFVTSVVWLFSLLVLASSLFYLYTSIFSGVKDPIVRLFMVVPPFLPLVLIFSGDFSSVILFIMQVRTFSENRLAGNPYLMVSLFLISATICLFASHSFVKKLSIDIWQH